MLNNNNKMTHNSDEFVEWLLQTGKIKEIDLDKFKARKLVQLGNYEFVYFDLETTQYIPGQQGRTEKIIEIGAVHRDQKFSTLVNPGIPIENSIIHKINNDDVINAPNIVNALNALISWLPQDKTVILIAHNGAAFDRKILQRDLTSLNIQVPMNILLADSLYPISKIVDAKDKKLESLYKKLFGEEYIERHRAFEDSIDLRCVCEKAEKLSNKDLINIFENYIYCVYLQDI
tara:strand:+ start:824 stop:1519 length:696 start_codon:yes stop_codon:yes gene_type:complete